MQMLWSGGSAELQRFRTSVQPVLTISATVQEPLVQGVSHTDMPCQPQPSDVVYQSILREVLILILILLLILM